MQPGTYKMGTMSPQQIAAVDKAYREGQAEEARKKEAIDVQKSKEGVRYTIFASGLRNGRLSELEGKNSTTDIAIIFDAVETHSYGKSYNKTSYAVESRAKASDHVVTQDGTFSFTGRITSSPYFIDNRNIIDVDTDWEHPMEAKRPEKALEILQRIADSHQLISLVTEDNILSGYVITRFTVTRTTSEGAAIVVSVELEEFRFKQVGRTVLARTADPKKAGNKNSGSKQTAEGGAADDAAKGKRQSPYLGGSREAYEYMENKGFGTTDFSGKAGAQIKPTVKFDPASLQRPGA
ncbi:hypothetical protein [Salmonella phage SSBI34]|nr:hypothetical protein [Salmonella phage SSBI34]